jgi:kynurenine 3-monooxygenase
MKKRKIAVVGAGLCGTLLAVHLARKGHEIHLFERRGDLRKEEVDGGRSINLALSDRGLQALSLVGMDQIIKEEVIPMQGRMLHDRKGESRFSPYSGRSGDYINSVSRGGLNAALLDLADQEATLTTYYNHACLNYEWANNELTFKTAGGIKKSDTFDHVFGTDGAGSAIRQTFMRNGNRIRFDYQQKYLTHGYKELEFPASDNGGFRVESNALHIWPRDEFMMIALPNLDHSFTVTLFQDFKGENGFDKLQEDHHIQTFFKEAFPDAIPHMPELIKDFHSNPTSSLGTIKCFPWSYEDKVLMIGDAVHAIVPFYGQGMNCAFEDVYVLDQFINEYGDDWNEMFEAYAHYRKPDTDAIADLALDNFYEMQDHVNDEAFILKRQLERKMEQAISDYYSKYSLVTFREDLRYHIAMQQGRFQDEYLLNLVRNQPNIEEINIHEVHEDLKKKLKESFPNSTD